MKRPPVYRIAIYQLLGLLLLSAGLSLMDVIRAQALITGGLIAIIPHLYFTFLAYRYMGARAAPQIAQSFKRAETGKFVLTITGFATVFAVLPAAQQQPGWLFGGYLAMLLVQVILVARAVR
ncbi:ATP synthase subunit I [Pseudomaricurvus sp. HS19]|uniref:ATP synthase subunit I n=1 Tax=Pseudomaricurvus sp. HS19 TaxID=2692626 RepID=UPI00136DE507|nr:ATP synthase subunit I [Pseudomaricurvus sp. HS19]MYM63788.1 ATP F0F1 synthase subunit I [Pseudomaricurvus sp. HS19]